MVNMLRSERYHLFMPDINVVMKVDIGGNPDIEALKKAIESAVNANEVFTFKITVLDNGDAVYERIGKPIYSVEISNKSWTEVIRENESRIFNLSEGELVRFFILTGEEDIQLLIVAHHLAGDGKSVSYLIEDIMLSLTGKELNFKPMDFTATKEFPKGSGLNPLMKLGIKIYNRKWLKSGRIFSYSDYEKMFNSFWKQRKTYICYGQLSGEELQVISKTANAYGVSVNSLITTAFARAYGKKADIGLAVSIRKKAYRGMGNYASGISILYTYDECKSLKENSQAVHKLIYKKLSKDKSKYFLLHFLESLEPTLLDSACMSTFGGYNNKTAKNFAYMMGYDGYPKDISITNLTRLDIRQNYGKYSIKNFIFTPPIVANGLRVIGIASLCESVSFTMHVLDDENLDKERKYFSEVMGVLKTL
jgi:NRPS condensation-like uncharacterized protein